VLSEDRLREGSDGILTQDETILQMVRLEGLYPHERQRYLCLVRSSRKPASDGKSSREASLDSYALLGIDYSSSSTCSEDPQWRPTLGFVALIRWDTSIQLDGDGGFSLFQRTKSVADTTTHHFVFKPVSVQALWTVIQTLSMIKEGLPTTVDNNETSEGGGEKPKYLITSSQSCINEWHAMTDLLVKRPPSPDSAKVSDAETTIKHRLRDIMKTVDLDSITSKVIRLRLEQEMGESLERYKSFIDTEILQILGQMDPPVTLILDYLYLGSAWNAGNLEELRSNGVTHILNVTREIDNYFPASFVYKNIRVYDEETTDLLKHFDTTYRFIRQAKAARGKVLVHCKMGISRSASVVISYMMKEYEMDLAATIIRVKEKRSVVNPNKSFIKQLEVYEGMQTAIRHRHTYYRKATLTRSKSESSLVHSSSTCTSGSGGPGPSGDPFAPAPGDEEGVNSATSPLRVSGHLTTPGTPGTGAKMRNRAKRSQSSRAAESYCKSVDVKALLVAYNRQISTSSATKGQSVTTPPNNTTEEAPSDRPRSWSPSRDVINRLKEEKSPSPPCRCLNTDLQQSFDTSPSKKKPVDPSDTKIAPSEEPPMHSTPNPSIGVAVNSQSGQFKPGCSCDLEVELQVPDDPVRILSPVGLGDDDVQTNSIVQNLSNVQIKGKLSQQQNPLPNTTMATEKFLPPSPSETQQATSELADGGDGCRNDSSSSNNNRLSSRGTPTHTTPMPVTPNNLFRRSSAAGDYSFHHRQAGSPIYQRRSDPSLTTSASYNRLSSCQQQQRPLAHQLPTAAMTATPPADTSGNNSSTENCDQQQMLKRQKVFNAKNNKNTDILSVKTLANMFDFKTSPMTTGYGSRHSCCATLEDNKLFQKAKVRSGSETIDKSVAKGVVLRSTRQSIIDGHRRNTTAGHNILITTTKTSIHPAESNC